MNGSLPQAGAGEGPINGSGVLPRILPSMSTPTPPASRPPSRQSGFTFVELTLAMTILVIAVLGAVGTTTAVGKLGDSNHESSIAYQAARAQMERLQAEPFATLLARYNEDGTDDPEGAGTAPGAHFEVAGLNLRRDDADGFGGRVLLPLDGAGEVREDLVDLAFGLPFDLTGDGEIDDVAHHDDLILLPVRVRVEWTGESGDRFVEFASILGLR